MNNEELAQAITDTQVDLAEANESSDLEGRFKLTMKLFELLKLAVEGGGLLNRHTCGNCHGTGTHEQFNEEWECPTCDGEGSEVY